MAFAFQKTKTWKKTSNDTDTGNLQWHRVRNMMQLHWNLHGARVNQVLGLRLALPLRLER
jgi:hypothetical protein